MLKALEERDGGLVLRIRVQPKASREALKGVSETTGTLLISLTAPPVDGEANAALIAFVAKRLGTPKSSVRLLSGEKSREKVLFVPGKSAADTADALGIRS